MIIYFDVMLNKKVMISFTNFFKAVIKPLSLTHAIGNETKFIKSGLAFQ